jgi:hypothetical protein
MREIVNPMSLRRAALCVGGATLIAAWFAAAASEPRQRDQPRAEPTSSPQSETERLAAGVQAQAVRLRERLASAPVPQQPVRNPFTFDRHAEPASRPAARPIEFVAPPPSVPAAPALMLVGVAEQRQPAGLVRIAMLSGDGDDVLMAKVGESVIGRYEVLAIDPEAVELRDTVTGATRRLVLR